VETDISLEEVLGHKRTGFLTKDEISLEWGARVAVHCVYMDALFILKDCVYITEIKTKGEKIKGLGDVYKGVGQVIMYRELFKEDYPSVFKERETRGLLLTEQSEIDVKLIEKPFISQNIDFFDPTRGGFLIQY